MLNIAAKATHIRRLKGDEHIYFLLLALSDK